MCIVEVLAVSVSLVAVRKRQLDRALVAALSFSQCISNTILQFMPNARVFFFFYSLFTIRYTLHVIRFALFTIRFAAVVYI